MRFDLPWFPHNTKWVEGLEGLEGLEGQESLEDQENLEGLADLEEQAPTASLLRNSRWLDRNTFPPLPHSPWVCHPLWA